MKKDVKKDTKVKKAPAVESTTGGEASTSGDTAAAFKPTGGALLALEVDLTKVPDVKLPIVGNVSPVKSS